MSTTGGKLVFVVGPSGAGKDSLLRYAAARLSGDARFVFPRRVITRAARQEAESHESLNEEEFIRAARQGLFAIRWEAHGLRYGIPMSIDGDLGAGRTVAVNVSRNILADAARRYRNHLIVAVEAPAAVLGKRLAERGRENAAEIPQRIVRKTAAFPSDSPVVTIVNDAALTAAGERLVTCCVRPNLRTIASPALTHEPNRVIAWKPEPHCESFAYITGGRWSSLMMLKTIALLGALMAPGVLWWPAPAASETWSSYRDSIYDCALHYPSSVFSADPIDMAEKAQRFSGPEKAIYFRIMGADNTDRLSPAEIRAKYLQADVPGDVTYGRTKAQFLVLSGYRGDAIFYTRVAVSADERTLCILEITYPKRVKKAFDAIVTRMSRSFSVRRGE